MNSQFKQLMIRLDPEEENDDEDQPMKPAIVQQNAQQLPNTSQAIYKEIDINNHHMNNLQVNVTKIEIPPDVEIASNYVSLEF